MSTKKSQESSGPLLAGLKKTSLSQAVSGSGWPSKSSKKPKYCLEYKGSNKKIISVHPECVMEATILLHPRSGSYKEEIRIFENSEIAQFFYDYEGKVRTGLVYVYKTSGGEYGLDFLPDSDDPWTEARRAGVLQGQDSWVKITYDKDQECYRTNVYPKSFSKPSWPEDIDALINDILQDCMISSEDDPLVQRYMKAAFEGLDDGHQEPMNYPVDGLLDDDNE